MKAVDTGGVPLRQVRQEKVDSDVQGLKKCKGESSSSSQQFQCTILPSRNGGLKKRKRKKKNTQDEWFTIKTKEWKEGRISFFDECMSLKMSYKNMNGSYEGEVGCTEGIKPKFPPIDRCVYY